MTLEITVAELAETKDLDLGSSPWRRLVQDRIDTFATATDDHQWIHVDPERAAEGPFGRTIAHGYLTLSLVPSLLKQLMVITDHGRGTNYGRTRCASPHPSRWSPRSGSAPRSPRASVARTVVSSTGWH